MSKRIPTRAKRDSYRRLPTNSPNSIGAWIRKQPRRGKRPETARQWAERRIGRYDLSEVSIVTNPGVGEKHKSRWQDKTLAECTREAFAVGAAVVWWMVWSVSKKSAIDEQVAEIAKMRERYALLGRDPNEVGIELDVEESWHRASGRRLAEYYLRELYRIGVRRICFTVVIYPKGFRSQDLALIRLARTIGFEVIVLAPQAYSKDDPSKSWDDPWLFRSGVLEDHCWRFAEPLLREGIVDRIVMGQMGAFQDHPGDALDYYAAHLRAHSTCYALGARHTRYWVEDLFPDYTRAFIEDAPFIGAVDPWVGSEQPDPVPNKRALVKKLQQALADSGYDPGPIDGLLGARTRMMARAWSRDAHYFPAEFEDPAIDDLLDELGLGEATKEAA